MNPSCGPCYNIANGLQLRGGSKPRRRVGRAVAGRLRIRPAFMLLESAGA